MYENPPAADAHERWGIHPQSVTFEGNFLTKRIMIALETFIRISPSSCFAYPSDAGWLRAWFHI